METFKESLKTALCNNDISFLEKNKEYYNINERFQDEDNDSLLLYTISDAGSNAYLYLLENGADINALNNEGEGILHAVVFSGDTSRIDYMLAKYEIDINLRAKDGSTALLLALSLNCFDIAEALIKKGADVNIPDNDLVSPLHLAAEYGSLDIVVMLAENGAIVKNKTKNGNYPLALAINNDNNEIVNYLYDNFYAANTDLKSIRS